MAEKPEDLGLPHAIVNRIINEALPAHTNVSAEARRVIGKTASVFVLYVTATSANSASKHGRKTMNSSDVMAAVEEMDFHQFIEPLQKTLEHFRETQKTKKNNSAKKTSEGPPPAKKAAAATSTKTATSPNSKSKKSTSSTPSPPRKSASTPSSSKKSSPTTSGSSKKSTASNSSTSKRKSSAGPSTSTSKKSSPVNHAPEVVSVSDSSDSDAD